MKGKRKKQQRFRKTAMKYKAENPHIFRESHLLH